MDHLCVVHPFLLGLNQSANGLLATFERPFLAVPYRMPPHQVVALLSRQTVSFGPNSDY